MIRPGAPPQKKDLDARVKAGLEKRADPTLKANRTPDPPTGVGPGSSQGGNADDDPDPGSERPGGR